MTYSRVFQARIIPSGINVPAVRSVFSISRPVGLGSNRMEVPLKRLALVFAPIVLISAAFGQETVTLPAKPQNPRAGRVLELREVSGSRTSRAGSTSRGPRRSKPSPTAASWSPTRTSSWVDAAGKFVVNMFRPGQGPGELRRITDFLVRGPEVLAFQEQPLKCVVSGLDGKFLREFRPDAPVSRLLGLYGDRLLMASNSAIPFDKVKKPEGDILDIVWTLALASPEGAVKATSLAYATKWFAKRLPGAFIANNLTFLLCAPLEGGLVAVVNEDVYGIRIADPAKNAAVRTIRRDYRRMKFEEEKSPDAPAGARSLAEPREYVNDIQRLFAVDGRIWALTSTLVPGKGVLVDVVSPRGEYVDAFYLPLPKGVSVNDLARHPLTIAGRSLLVLEELEDGRLEVVKYEIAR